MVAQRIHLKYSIMEVMEEVDNLLFLEVLAKMECNRKLDNFTRLSEVVNK